MNDRRANGLCCFCDEPYPPKHSLTNKKLQVHLLEIRVGNSYVAKKYGCKIDKMDLWWQMDPGLKFLLL